MPRAAYNTDAKESYQTIDLPLYLPYEGPGATASFTSSFGPSQYLKNTLVSVYENKVTGKTEFELAPRNGYQVSETYSTAFSDVFVRGIFYWDKTDLVYSLFANTLTSSVFNSGAPTALTTTYTGTASIYQYGHFTEFFDGSAYFLVTKKTHIASKAYSIDSANAITEITDADYPSATAVGQFVAMDGYVFVMTTLGKIYNSDLGSSLSWTSTSNIVATVSPDGGVGLSKYKNQIVAFGTNSVEFFYNASNPTGSPLARTEQAAITGIGCINAKTIVEMDDTIYWIAAGIGVTGIYVLDNFKPKKISNAYIDKLISRTYSIGGEFYAGRIVILGKECYYFGIVGVASTDTGTFIYMPEIDLWMIWTTESGSGSYNNFGTVTASILPSAQYPLFGYTMFPTIGDNTARKIIIFGQTTGGDEIVDGGTVYFPQWVIRFRPLDFGTRNAVRLHKLILKVTDTGFTIPVNLKINNLGRYENLYLTIAKTGALNDMTVAVNTGAAKSFSPSLTNNSPTILSGQINYSICER